VRDRAGETGGVDEDVRLSDRPGEFGEGAAVLDGADVAGMALARQRRHDRLGARGIRAGHDGDGRARFREEARRRGADAAGTTQNDGVAAGERTCFEGHRQNSASGSAASAAGFRQRRGACRIGASTMAR
jgi:hypothetical protein